MAVLTTCFVAVIYSIMSSLPFGGVITGDEARNSLSFWKDSSASSVHSKFPSFFNSLKKDNPFSPNHEINLFNAAMHPISFCMSFTFLGGFMSIIALTCFVLASIPRLLTKNPSSCPDGTPKTHLVGFSFHCHAFKFLKVSSRSSINELGSFVLITTSSM